MIAIKGTMTARILKGVSPRAVVPGAMESATVRTSFRVVLCLGAR